MLNSASSFSGRQCNLIAFFENSNISEVPYRCVEETRTLLVFDGMIVIEISVIIILMVIFFMVCEVDFLEQCEQKLR